MLPKRKLKAGFRATLLLLVPLFIFMTWALISERDGLLFIGLLVWLVLGNLLFWKAYRRKKQND